MFFHSPRLATALITLLLLVAGCSDESAAIHQLLDAREAAISNHDIVAYEQLLDVIYIQPGSEGEKTISRMAELFSQFDKMEMTSSDRTIYFVDDNHALCEQSYRLRVLADGKWREVVQRERIEMIRSGEGWKISGGLL